MTTPRTDRSPDPPRASARVAGRMRVLPLLAVSLGYFMVILDATIVTVALPALGGDLHAGVAGLQWWTPTASPSPACCCSAAP